MAFNYQIGTSGNDSLYGGAADDVFFGYEGDDYLIDNVGGKDYMYAGEGNDYLYSGQDDDYLYGYGGNDTLIGAQGNDHLYGNSGNDLLIGSYVTGADAGKGEIDVLSGGSESDRFILGSNTSVFYDSDTSWGLGTEDYALITDFNPTQDRIELHGSSSEYVIGGSGIQGISGLGIYHMQSGSSFELIGVLQDVAYADVSLTNPSQFTYV